MRRTEGDFYWYVARMVELAQMLIWHRMEAILQVYHYLYSVIYIDTIPTTDSGLLSNMRQI